MTPERWRQMEELYEATRALSPSQRTALLERADPELRAEVALLLAQEEIPGDGAFLDRPAWEGRESLLQHDGPLQAETTVSVGEQLGPRRIQPPAHLKPGVRLGPYQLEALLGEGGMGEVFRARDTRLGRPVAIKVIRAERAQRPDFRSRGHSGAQSSAHLHAVRRR